MVTNVISAVILDGVRPQIWRFLFVWWISLGLLDIKKTISYFFKKYITKRIYT